MSRRMSYICDICGADITGTSSNAISQESAQIRIWEPGLPRSYGGTRMDLCLRCYEGFVNFLEVSGKEVEE